MARDEEFIPMRLALAEDPRVSQIGARAGLDLDQTLGKLYRLWSWVRRHTNNGQAKVATVEWIDGLVNCKGFCAALMSQDWLRERKGGGLTFPSASQWIDRDSKARQVERDRKRRLRERLQNSVSRDSPGTVPGHVPTEKNEKESKSKRESKKKKEGSSEPPSTAASEPPDSPAWCDFQTVGKVKTWTFTHEHRARLMTSFPNVDVSSEARKAQGWIEANPSKRKTPGGMAAFLWRWMERCANRGGASPVGTNGATPHPSPAERRRAEVLKAIDEVK